jgi:hypothetical protein
MVAGFAKEISGYSTSGTVMGIGSLTFDQATEKVYYNGVELNTAGGPVSAISARAYQSAEQTIPSGYGTWLSFNAEYYDTDGLFTPPSTMIYAKRRAGYYLVLGQVEFKANASGFRYALLCKNASTYLAANECLPLTGWESALNVQSVVYLAVNDYVRMMVYQNSGGNLNTAAGDFVTWLSLIYLSS